MPSQITLGVAPLGGGTLQPLLTESLWLGGGRFFVIYAQSNPNMLNAQVIDISLDPYASGTPTQVVTTNQNITNLLPQDRPMLYRLDSNRVLMFWSAVNKADTYLGTNFDTKAFDAWVLEIDGSNNVIVKTQLASVVPCAFMNYTQAYYQPTATRAIGANTMNTGVSSSCYSTGNTTAITLSADGAAVNRLLLAVRQTPVGPGTGDTTQFARLWDVTYTVATTTLSLVPRFTISSPLFKATSNNNGSLVGADDFAFVYPIPGTTKVLFGAIFYDPQGGLIYTTPQDAYRTNTATSQFVANNTFYTFDTTQSPTTWTATNTIVNARRAAIMAPLDSDRMLELTSQVCTTGTTNYGRVYSLSAGTFTPDIPTDAGQVLVNKNGSLAFGVINQLSPLGNDHLILSVTTRLAAPTIGTTGTPYYGIYRLIGNSLLQATASFGVPLLAPLTFQRTQEALIKRSAGQDPNNTSPNLLYDYYGRTGQLTYVFLRYTNPF